MLNEYAVVLQTDLTNYVNEGILSDYNKLLEEHNAVKKQIDLRQLYIYAESTNDVILNSKMRLYSCIVSSFLSEYNCCPMCYGLHTTVERRKQSTQYQEEESNYITCCEECFKQVQEYWKERWEEYYSSRL